MRLIRFMGRGEILRYFGGEVLRNNTSWEKQGYRSNSKGFCFFPASPPPEERLHYLSGIVSFDCVAEFEALELLRIRAGTGEYRDLSDLTFCHAKSLAEILLNPPRRIKVEEYSLTEYSRDTLKLIRLGRVSLGGAGWQIEWL